MRKDNAMLTSLITLALTPLAALWLKRVTKLGFLLMMGVSMSACSAVSWKEEVLLHDGSKIVVSRSQSHGGRREIGQPSPIKEHAITFALPSSNQTITWRDEFSEEIGHSNFNLLALHILNGIPFIVASPDGCLAYNKWGRPNPPYVFFKYDGNTWQRIPLSEFPAELKEINLVINTLAHETEISSQSPVRAELVKKLNSSLGQPEFKTILREPVKRGVEGSSVNCEVLVHYKCGWTGVNSDGTFNKEFMDRMCR